MLCISDQCCIIFLETLSKILINIHPQNNFMHTVPFSLFGSLFGTYLLVRVPILAAEGPYWVSI